ncbi:hypothetical protein M422DRAFT_250351 [Sphaerobolus stellatus SS14]|uniref:Uncharacterized protein n=1 Tax=Sphaerobolus stellatus (strain SS14) TaxID=990650 RepID=A0A0C9VUD2_SPHS4|nr:hypothetical protein M422DRAFT_250351 [Sphaerobolus stellatus SS14]
MSSSYPPVEPPDSRILLYIGAGYDLSPVLTFAPKGQRYPILPLSRTSCYVPPWPMHRYTYTSFIFVDAKPRHTSAFMVPDFNEWETYDARVKNVVHSSQGMLTRWRTVPGAPDLIIFEGGGSSSQITSRRADPDWNFALGSRWRPAKEDTSRPLTTLFYLFNTLDIEMVRAPRMEKLWRHVEALYVHGLRIHPLTGAGIGPGIGAGFGVNASMPSHDSSEKGKGRGVEPIGPLPSELGEGLKRCFVLVGSWDGKNGIRHVDFVQRAIQKRRHRLTIQAPLPSFRNSTSSEDISVPERLYSPVTFADHPSTPSISSSRTSISSTPSTPSPATSTSLPSESAPSIPTITLASTTSHLTSNIHRRFASSISHFFFHSPSAHSEAKKIHFPTISPPSHPYLFNSTPFDPFHIPIPQIAYSSSLPQPPLKKRKNPRNFRSKKGAYYISRTIEECMELSREEGTNWEDELERRVTP